MRKVTQNADRVYGIWVNLIQELQIKSEVVVSSMKTKWENRSCGPKEDLSKFLDDDDEMVEEIHNAGGEVSDVEIRSHILKVIPSGYLNFVNTLIESLALQGLVVETDALVESLKQQFEYRSRTNTQNSNPSHNHNNVALSAEATSNPSQSNRGNFRGRGRGGRGVWCGGYRNSPPTSRTCYNCGKPGHLQAQCPENGPRTGGPTGTGQANIVEVDDEDFAYLAESESADSDSDSESVASSNEFDDLAGLPDEEEEETSEEGLLCSEEDIDARLELIATLQGVLDLEQELRKSIENVESFDNSQLRALWSANGSLVAQKSAWYLEYKYDYRVWNEEQFLHSSYTESCCSDTEDDDPEDEEPVCEKKRSGGLDDLYVFSNDLLITDPIVNNVSESKDRHLYPLTQGLELRLHPQLTNP